MSRGKVTPEQVTEALAGERVIIPLTAGKFVVLWAVEGKLYLTPAGRWTTLIAADALGERAGEVTA